MIELVRDLVRHKIYANTQLLAAVAAHPAAARDDDVRTLLHHILVSNRFWLLLSIARPFGMEREKVVPASLETVRANFEATHALELEWLSRASDEDLRSTIEWPRHPGQPLTVAQAMMQICLHSHGHRAQCATMLRSLGGTPPTLDYIQWVSDQVGDASHSRQ